MSGIPYTVTAPVLVHVHRPGFTLSLAVYAAALQVPQRFSADADADAATYLGVLFLLLFWVCPTALSPPTPAAQAVLPAYGPRGPQPAPPVPAGPGATQGGQGTQGVPSTSARPCLKREVAGICDTLPTTLGPYHPSRCLQFLLQLSEFFAQATVVSGP